MLLWLFSTYSTYVTVLRTQWSHPSLWVTLQNNLCHTQHKTITSWKIKHTLGSEFTNLETWSGHYPDLLSDLNCQNQLKTSLATFSGLVGVDTNTSYRESDVKACHTGTVHVLNKHWALLQALPQLDYKLSRGVAVRRGVLSAATADPHHSKLELWMNRTCTSQPHNIMSLTYSNIILWQSLQIKVNS